MTTDVEILQILAKMPESLRQELVRYAKSLMATHSKLDISDDEKEKPAKRGGLGIWKGKIWISDDFDQSLEDFKDYM
jgi:hypothetical protein